MYTSHGDFLTSHLEPRGDSACIPFDCQHSSLSCNRLTADPDLLYFPIFVSTLSSPYQLQHLTQNTLCQMVSRSSNRWEMDEKALRGVDKLYSFQDICAGDGEVAVWLRALAGLRTQV